MFAGLDAKDLILFSCILVWGMVAWCLLCRREKPSRWMAYCDPALWAYAQTRIPRNRWWVCGLLLLWAVSIGLCAWGFRAEQRESRAAVVLLELSSEMPSTALSQAKQAIHDWIVQHPNTRIALLVFSKRAFVIAPLTLDHDTLDFLLPQLQTDIMPVAGADIGRGLQLAKRLLNNAGEPHGQMWLLTTHAASAKDIQVARELIAQGNLVQVTGLGDERKPETVHSWELLARACCHSRESGNLFYSVTPASSVIPAKAGIFSAFVKIPAFAGMTRYFAGMTRYFTGIAYLLLALFAALGARRGWCR